MRFIKKIKPDNILLINSSSLFLIYFFNFFISIIILPKLISIFGLRGWGEITFCQIIINYFIWFIDWSFPQHSCKLISINEKDPEKRNQIFNKTINSQFILFFISSLLLIIYALTFSSNKYVFLYGVLIIFGSLLQPYWYLNGREKLYETAIFQLVNKLIFTFCIYSFFKENEKIDQYFLFFGISNLIVGILCSLRIKFYYLEKINFENIKKTFNFILSSSELFISSIIGNFTTSVIPFLIGSFYSLDRLGIYNIAERIKNITIQIINPISHSLFPRISKYYFVNKKEGNKILKKYLLLVISISILIFVFINLFMTEIIQYFTLENLKEINQILKILMLSFLSNIIYEVIINQYIIVNGLYQQLNNVKLLILFSCIALGIPLIFKFGIIGAATTSLIYELVGLSYAIKIFLSTKNNEISIIESK